MTRDTKNALFWLAIVIVLILFRIDWLKPIFGFCVTAVCWVGKVFALFLLGLARAGQGF